MRSVKIPSYISSFLVTSLRDTHTQKKNPSILSLDRRSGISSHLDLDFIVDGGLLKQLNHFMKGLNGNGICQWYAVRNGLDGV